MKTLITEETEREIVKMAAMGSIGAAAIFILRACMSHSRKQQFISSVSFSRNQSASVAPLFVDPE